ncbi:hypothetical protein FOCC_FOCC011967 [Frankliniella occidentalis]|nr:hypothetical protein FOCC_FOCC011967 [Frankliniella occidentalis]
MLRTYRPHAPDQATERSNPSEPDTRHRSAVDQRRYPRPATGLMTPAGAPAPPSPIYASTSPRRSPSAARKTLLFHFAIGTSQVSRSDQFCGDFSTGNPNPSCLDLASHGAAPGPLCPQRGHYPWVQPPPLYKYPWH